MRRLIIATLITGLVGLTGQACGGDRTGQPDDVAAQTLTAQPVKTAVATVTGSDLHVGRYAYLADAAIMIDCFSGESWPVAYKANHLALERAYLETRRADAETLVVVFEGHLESLPGMEGDEERDHVVVDQFITFLPDRSCGGDPPAPLFEASWSLVQLADMAVISPADQRPPSLVLGSDSSLGGFTGCNVIGGDFRLAGSMIRLGRVATTKKYCPQVADLETAYTRALNRVIAYELNADTLRLITAEQESLLFVGGTE